MQERTIEILKNFASINQGIVFRKGSRLRTIAVMKNVFAVADIPDEIPRDFAIYDLNEFLSTLSLLDNPELDYREDHILISSDRTRIKFFYSTPAVVVSPPDRDIEMTNPLVKFVLSEANLSKILKASAALKLKNLGLSYGKLVAFNYSDTGTGVGNQIVIDVDSEGDDTAPEKLIKVENLKILPGSYLVEVFDRAVRFQNVADQSLVYYVTVEAAK